MLTTLLLLAAAPSAPDPAAIAAARLMADYRRMTQVAVHCEIRAEPGEVVVCGRRRTDRYRLPLIVRGDGGSRRDPTSAQREALLVPPSPCSQMGPFLIGCGAFGIGVGLSADGKGRLVGLRELSP